MAFYDYYCDTCNKKHEVERSIKAPVVDVKCACGATMRRLYAPTAIRFDGDGWQSNDKKS